MSWYKSAINPGDIDPKTGQPYDNFSSPSLQETAPEEHFTEQDQWQPNEGAQFVSVYKVERAYGGPEEGGWWYDAYSLVDSKPVATRAAGLIMKEFLQKKYAAENEERGPLDSSKGFGSLPEGTEDYQIPRGFSGGASQIEVVLEDEPGEMATTERPSYE